MNVKLFLEALIKIILGIVIVGALIFIPAGTVYFFNGWLLMLVLFLPVLIAGIIMMLKKPELLKRRLKSKETKKEQSLIVKLSALMFIMGFVMAGLDFRFSLSYIPPFVVIVSVIIFLMGFLLYAEVIRENEFLSRTIEISENQRVIDNGLYGIVRHPMYLSTLLLFLSMPVILGSLYSFLIFLAYPFIIVKRIKYEEEFLKKELDGYSEYAKKVKYRLIPFIW